MDKGVTQVIFINLPQNVNELATSLPRYPKELTVIVVKVKGKDNTFKDVTVRREKVHNALLWLLHNNPYYAELEINAEVLNSLPENGVPPDLMTIETEAEIVTDNSVMPDIGPHTDNASDDIVYNESTEMSSFFTWWRTARTRNRSCLKSAFYKYTNAMAYK